MKPSDMPDVGAPDPERRNSPIADESSWDEEGGPVGSGTDEIKVCYYNDVEYRVGDYVWAGNEALRCDAGGVWIRMDTELE